MAEPASPMPPIVPAADAGSPRPHQALPPVPALAGRPRAATGRDRRGRGGGELRHREGGDPGPRRGERLREDDHGPPDPAGAQAHAGRDPLPSRRPGGAGGPARGPGAPRPPPAHPDDLPGSVLVAEPAHAGRRDHRGAAPDPPAGLTRGDPGAREGAHGHGRPQRPVPPALPALLLRRPAAAHRDRARARAQPGAGRLRRAGVGAGRLGPGPGAESPEGSPERARADVPLHLAQPGGDRLRRRPDRRHVRGPDRRDRGRSGSCSSGPATPTPRRSWRRCSGPTPACAGPRSGGCATGRARRPAGGRDAATRPAAPTSSTAAGPRRRSCTRSGRTTWRGATGSGSSS